MHALLYTIPQNYTLIQSGPQYTQASVFGLWIVYTISKVSMGRVGLIFTCSDHTVSNTGVSNFFFFFFH